VARPVRYHQTFEQDVAAQLSWLRRHRAPSDRNRLSAALTLFTRRVGAHPAVGHEIERHGVDSYRVFHLGAGLPYLVWYAYSLEDGRGPVRLMRLLHESQDRERFDARDFD
jgi:plasmid stabilization system protein ParE